MNLRQEIRQIIIEANWLDHRTDCVGVDNNHSVYEPAMDDTLDKIFQAIKLYPGVVVRFNEAGVSDEYEGKHRKVIS